MATRRTRPLPSTDSPEGRAMHSDLQNAQRRLRAAEREARADNYDRPPVRVMTTTRPQPGQEVQAFMAQNVRGGDPTLTAVAEFLGRCTGPEDHQFRQLMHDYMALDPAHRTALATVALNMGTRTAAPEPTPPRARNQPRAARTREIRTAVQTTMHGLWDAQEKAHSLRITEAMIVYLRRIEQENKEVPLTRARFNEVYSHLARWFEDDWGPTRCPEAEDAMKQLILDVFATEPASDPASKTLTAYDHLDLV